MTTALLERRSSILEVRARGRKLSGYAALFDIEAKLGPITEIIARGAFTEAPASDRDIVALLDHDSHKLLGRRSSSTLELRQDGKGLAFDLSLPDTTSGRDVLALAERGDLGGMSFGFKPKAGGETWNGQRRTLTKIDLVEVSVVSAFPAYPETGDTISARSAPKGVRLALARHRLALAEAGG